MTDAADAVAGAVGGFGDDVAAAADSRGVGDGGTWARPR